MATRSLGIPRYWGIPSYTVAAIVGHRDVSPRRSGSPGTCRRSFASDVSPVAPGLLSLPGPRVKKNKTTKHKKTTRIPGLGGSYGVVFVDLL